MLRAAVTLVAALGLGLCLASPAQAAVSLGIGPQMIHPGTVVEIAGAKNADAAVRVTVQPPGHVVTDVSTACTGTGSGSTAWSCAVAPPGAWALGDTRVVAISTGPSGTEEAMGRFVVVPDAVRNAHPTPTPPLSTPVPTPTPTPTPTLTPTPTPTPTRGPGPPPRVVPAAVPAPRATSVPAVAVSQLPTLAQPVEPAPARAPSVRHAAASPRTAPPAPRVVLGDRVPTLQQILAHPESFAAAGGLGSLLLLLIAIPAHFLDDTVGSNAWRFHRARAGLAALLAPLTAVLAPVRTLWRRLPHLHISVPIVIVLASVAFGFADPEYGADADSLRSTLSLIIGLGLVLPLPAILTARIALRRWHAPAHLVAQPAALALSIIGVLASRTFGFEPGLLIGLVMGLELAVGARESHHRWATTLRLSLVAAVSVLCWMVYSLVHALGEQAIGFGWDLARESLGAAADEGLTGLVVALLPITFMEGKELFGGSRRTWAALAIPSAFLFALIVVPTSLEDTTREPPLWLIATVLAGFGVLAMTVWLIFRELARHDPAPVEAPEEEPAVTR
ncbi:hypothetical protein GCM10009840_30820 [Pseudolysinimonas kribbensis]|uniref:Uncharacterized protein n=1 Tax=Pseudolysinimonas kribbensis TaxID=433641 RepID=A0ABQ6K8K0_9MICO|nr:hypothetical protein GCM10025881_28850 [Pseudolysinimonas kribbensis]